MKILRRILPFLILTSLILCVFPLPTAQAKTTVTLDEKAVYDGGYTTISWTVSGDEADVYYVFVTPVSSGNVEQPLFRVAETKGHSVRTTECIPGKRYEVTVTNSSYAILDQTEYTMDAPVTFEDGKLKNTSVKISFEPRKMLPGGKPQKVKALKASDILSGARNSSAYYGIRYEMKMPQLAKPRSFFVTLAFEAPNGFLYVEQAESVTFDRVNDGYQTLWWNITGANFFLNLYSKNSEIPAGPYKAYLYWDGMWVNTLTFNVD